MSASFTCSGFSREAFPPPPLQDAPSSDALASPSPCKRLPCTSASSRAPSSPDSQISPMDSPVSRRGPSPSWMPICRCASAAAWQPSPPPVSLMRVS
eukprot:scaffold189017_cov29-Tisochrysis_lutea.AAC.2